MLNLKAILMALGGVIVVGGIGTYVVLENRKTQEAPVEASLPAATDQAVKDEPVASASDTSSSDTQSNDAAATSSEEQATSEAATSEPVLPTADWVMPAFDLLRVEPDGSTVIAGRGEPNTTLKIMNGEEMIAETKIGSSGDFVVIFDEALNSGDYQLSLQVEDENGLALTSEETAIVSVPEDASGQLLAMVQTPGEASRIITQPEAAPADETTTTAESATEEQPVSTTDVAENTATATEEVVEKAVEIASNTETSVTGAAAATENAVETTTEMAAKTETETVSETETKVSEATTEANSVGEEKAAEMASNDTTEETVVAGNTETTVAETLTSEVADAAEKVMKKVTEGAVETTEKVQDTAEKAIETAKAAVETGVEKAVEETENTVAALVTEESTVADNSQNTDVQTSTAVESEQPKDEKMETSTSEPKAEDTQAAALTTEEKPAVEKPKAPSQNVRIEAVEVEGNKLFVAGSGTAGYQVRVFADGEEVGLANVESNGRFIVEATKDLAVGQHKITAALEDKQTDQVILRAIVPFNRPEGEALAAVASNDNAASEGKPATTTETETAMVKEETKSADTLASTGDETKTEVASTTETPSSAATNGETTTSETAPASDAGTVAADSQSTETPAEEVAAVATEEKMDKSEGTTTNVASSETAVETTTTTTTTSTTTTTTAAASASDVETSEPKTIVQDELQPASAQSVIIRRGDTLWQIARRTYGAGVRYTTIYLANQQQIANPDRISPGQIFDVPEEALENAEQLHRQRLGLE